MAEEKTAGAAKAAPAKAAATGSGDDNLFGALCYIISVLVPLFVLFTEKKSNKTLAFHAWQSLMLTVTWFVVFVVFSGVVVVVSLVTSGIGGVLSCLYIPLWLAALVTFLFPAYKAYMNEKYLLPVIGDFADKQASK
jgi:uncharacterized membrane protein